MKIFKKTGAVAIVAAIGFGVPYADAMQGEGQKLTQEQRQGTGASMATSASTVRQVQKKLNSKGYNSGQVDGALGTKTKQAVKSFQEAQGLEATGQLNQETLSALGVSASEGSAAGGAADKNSDQMKSDDRDLKSGAGTGGSTQQQESGSDMKNGSGSGTGGGTQQKDKQY